MKEAVTTYLKFTDEAQAIEVLANFRQDDAWITHKDGTDIDVIGLIFQPTGVMLEGEEGPVPEMAALEGYHVNMIGPVPEAVKPHVIPAPQQPVRVFFGG
jgi:hypothetical protein